MGSTPEKFLIPENEKERLAKLYGYNIGQQYDTTGKFQHVASMAAHIFQVPLAFVSFVGEESILIKASVGLDSQGEVGRELGLCSLAVLKDEVTVFENAKEEQLLSGHPLVHGDPGLQFYAGAPIKTPDGFNIGVVAIADKVPRAFPEEERQILQGLADVVLEELEARQALHKQ